MGEVEDAALPPGWAWARLGEIAFVSGGLTKNQRRDTSGMEEAPFLRVANVQAGRVDLDELHRIWASASEIERLTLLKRDLLIVEGNGSLSQVGRCAIWDGNISGCIHQNHIIRVRLKNPDQAAWVLHWLSSLGGRKFVEHVASSTSGLHTLSISKVEGLPIPVAPEREQKQILSLATDCLDDVSDVEAAMKRARERMTDYRASLLHAACTGALTANWRDANPHPEEDGPALLCRILVERRAAWERAELARLTAAGKVPRGENWRKRYSEPRAAQADERVYLPKGWTWASLDELSSTNSYGTSAKCQALAEGTPVIRIPNVKLGRIEWTDMKYSTVDLGLTEIDHLVPGDLIIVRTNGSRDLVGRAALVDVVPDAPTYFASYLIRFRLSAPEKLRLWVAKLFQSEFVRSQIEGVAATSAGQYNVSSTNLAGVYLPIPPLAEVKVLLTELDFVSIDMGEVAATGTQDLRQSILHAAFSGRLVPQDPADEPAAALLARLRADATQSTPRRRARAGAHS